MIWAGAAQAAQVTVFAAASLKPAIDPIAEAFEAATGHSVFVSYAATSLLARQIQQGAPADVFLSANTAWSDVLDGTGHVADAQVFARNRLVVVGAQAVAFDPYDAQAWTQQLGAGRLALGFLDAVPVGIYAREALDNLRVWDDLAARIVEADNARAALVLAERGEVPLAVVYATDAQSSEKVHVAAQIPADVHAQVAYVAARVSGGQDHGFVQFLLSPAAQDALLAAGFEAAP